MSKEDLQKEAQGKLADARRLIREAGELAKEGQFFLNFGEIGCFIPSSMLDKSKVREEAKKLAMEEGLTISYEELDWDSPLDADGNRLVIKPRVMKPWDELSEEEQEELVEQMFEDLWSDSPIPYGFREYADESDGDRWWHPSRC